MKKISLLSGLLSLVLIYSAHAAEKKIRVVSLSPSLTETIYQLGKGDLLVGRSLVCDYPEAAKKLPVAGNFNQPNVERLAMTRPDYVVCTDFRDVSMITKLRALGMKVLVLRDKSIDSYFDCIKQLGKIMKCEDAAEKEIKRLKDGLARYQKESDAIPLKKRPKVFFMLWDSPIMSIGKKSFLTKYISYAGGRSITAGITHDYFTSSLEYVLVKRPAVMICPSMHVDKTKEFKLRTGWKELPAVKNGRVYGGLNPDLMFRLGPRMLESIQVLKDCIYPEKSKKKEKK